MFPTAMTILGTYGQMEIVDGSLSLPYVTSFLSVPPSVVLFSRGSLGGEGKWISTLLPADGRGVKGQGRVGTTFFTIGSQCQPIIFFFFFFINFQKINNSAVLNQEQHEK